MAEWQRVLRWMQRRVGPRDDAMRVDRWLKQQFPSAPQSFLQKQLRQRKIRIVSSDPKSSPASFPAKSNMTLHSGAIVAIDAVVFDAARAADVAETRDLKTESELSSEARTFVETLVQRVVYTDDNYLVLNKPHGLAVQDGTALDHSLASYLPSLGAAFGNEEPLRLVHRLDKETSGLLVLARHRLAAARFSEVLRDGGVSKTYDALVLPVKQKASEIPLKGEISLPIDGKDAKTIFRRLSRPTDRADDSFWLEMQPVTGRKHQLRIHCAQGLQAPIIGDRRHGPLVSARREDRLFLHAKHLKFADPFRPGRKIDVACEMEAKPKTGNQAATPTRTRTASQNPTTTAAKKHDEKRRSKPSIPGSRSVSRREEGSKRPAE